MESDDEKSKATAKYGLVGLLGLTEDDAHKFFGINFQQVNLSELLSSAERTAAVPKIHQLP